MPNAPEQLLALYASTYEEPPHTVARVGAAAAGSNRQYYRLAGCRATVIGVVGNNKEENAAFVYLSRHFLSRHLPVPEVYAVSSDGLCYLQQDLGTRSLYAALQESRQRGGDYTQEEEALIRKALLALVDLQFRGAEGLDFSRCYPQPAFNAQSVLFDVNYFKYCFLKATGIEFNEVLLDEEAQRFAAALAAESLCAFMYRDYQARNILLDDNNNPHFIDYQGGRYGPCYYDVASFLWQATAQYSPRLRATLVDDYYLALADHHVAPLPTKDLFAQRLHLFVLLRILQVLGAYGFRGYVEQKTHFLRSIIPAIANLRRLLAEDAFPYPYLTALLQQVVALPQFNPPSLEEEKDGRRLTIEVWSFAYKYGVPTDRTIHGGGYVFDCRSTNNPARYDQFRHLTGRDSAVQHFLEDDGEITTYLRSVFALASHHVERYLARHFTHLFFAFGCTGGQHRSVYAAEQLARYLAAQYDVDIVVHHRELGIETTVCHATP